MIIITKSDEGHYGYYLSILQKHFNECTVVDLNNRAQFLIKKCINARREKFIVLNGDYLMRKKPFFFLLILILRIEVVQIFYNIDFLYKNNFRSFFLKNVFKFQKLFLRNVRNLSLVDHSANESLGLNYIPDPIDTSYQIPKIKKNESFILLFGTHGERKGTYNFLKKYKGDLDIFVVGKIVDRRIFEFKENKKLRIIEGFVSEKVKHEYFSKAKCVAIPYLDWHGSSGVLGHAILYNKVIIGFDRFHIGRILKEYTKSYIINIMDDSVNIDSSYIESLIDKESNSDEIIYKYYSESKFVEGIRL